MIGYALGPRHTVIITVKSVMSVVYHLYELAYPQLISFHECPSTIMILGLGYLIDVFIHIERNV